jgi:hypothetical protein
MTVTFFSFVLSNNAEAVTPKKIYLQSDTILPCAANGSVKFKGGTYVTVDTTNMNNVMNGTLAQDTILYYTRDHLPNKKVPAMYAKFKGGTTVDFLVGQGSSVGLVYSGELAEDTFFHVFSGQACNIDFFQSPSIAYKAGGKMRLSLTDVSGYPSYGMLARDTQIYYVEGSFLKFKGGTYVSFTVNGNGNGAFIYEGTLAGNQSVPFFNPQTGHPDFETLPDGTVVRFTLIGVCESYTLPNGTTIYR